MPADLLRCLFISIGADFLAVELTTIAYILHMLYYRSQQYTVHTTRCFVLFEVQLEQFSSQPKVYYPALALAIDLTAAKTAPGCA